MSAWLNTSEQQDMIT